MGVGGLCVLSVPMGFVAFLVIFIIAKVGYSCSLVFYDAMLSDVTTPERMDRVSSQGYAWGYIGSCVPFIASLAVVLFSGLPMQTGMGIAFFINGAWWLLTTVPLLKNYEQIHYEPRKPHAVAESFRRLLRVFQEIRGERKIFLFLIAFFFYIDGVYTIIDMATAFGSALGFTSTTLLLALLLTQIVAFPCALLFGWLAPKYENGTLIRICIVAYGAWHCQSSWTNPGSSGSWRCAWACSRAVSRRCPGPILQKSFRRKNRGNILDCTIFSEKAPPLWELPWWVLALS